MVLTEKTKRNFAQKQKNFEEASDAAVQRYQGIAREMWLRRLLAYGFKIAAGLGALAVAYGLKETYAHMVGMAVAVCVFLDGVLSNHERLLVCVYARRAYAKLLERIAHDYNIAVIPGANTEEDYNSNIATVVAHAILLHDQRERLEDALATADLRFLKKVSLQGEKQLEPKDEDKPKPKPSPNPSPSHEVADGEQRSAEAQTILDSVMVGWGRRVSHATSDEDRAAIYRQMEEQNRIFQERWRFPPLVFSQWVRLCAARKKHLGIVEFIQLAGEAIVADEITGASAQALTDWMVEKMKE